ncbi:MAG TPA: glycosyltransferase family A protein [Thermoleophilia bacterium]|nr:glycosyltransferase family A protein [Thermoleophilia bacterium]
MVAIGRNEGERLRRCLDALPTGTRHVAYVDSGSTDDSVEQARSRGVDVLRLDMSVPFTAARARNAGLRRLRERWPELRFVQVLDGDCTLAPGWLEAAVTELDLDPGLAVVCGRRREAHPEASIYNRLCDMEWDTPVGDAASCGGDALLRMSAISEAGGYDDRLIAGEEPELCARLRARGWKVRRLDHEMTLHDAGMTRFAQWWRRSVRSGHAYAEIEARHPGLFSSATRSIVTFGLVLPALAILSAPFTGGLGLALLLAFPALGLRILLRRCAQREALRDAALYACFCVLGKFPELAGMTRYWWNWSRGRRAAIIEYK